MNTYHSANTPQFEDFFLKPTCPAHKQYEALRSLCVEKLSAHEVAKKFGYTVCAVHSLKRDFKKEVLSKVTAAKFFKETQTGRKINSELESAQGQIIELRKQNNSILDIKLALQAQDIVVSHEYIDQVLKNDGFARLLKRTVGEKKSARSSTIEAPKSVQIDWKEDLNKTFHTEQGAGILAFIPLIRDLKIDKWVEDAKYPGTTDLSAMNMILSFLALKLSGNERYSRDSLWALDRAFGLFAGLNVLPKSSTLSTYSYRVSRDMNVRLLKSMFKELSLQGFISGSSYFDFTSLPHWGEQSVLEKNWSGTRGKALKSILSGIAQDAVSGIICYSDGEIKHKNQNDSILEFADFYKTNGDKLSCLIFDSKVTTYQNLEKLDKDGVEFFTIRRRNKKLIENLPKDDWKEVVLERSKKQKVKLHDSQIQLTGTETDFRQIIITEHGRLKPTFILTNNKTLTPKQIVEKYSKRWNIEKGISEQISFFHLNSLSSSIVVKVDFDLTMSVLAHNLYRVFAQKLDGFEKQTAQSLNDKFFINGGQIVIQQNSIDIKLKKKRHLPILLAAMDNFKTDSITWFGKKKINFHTWTTS